MNKTMIFFVLLPLIKTKLKFAQDEKVFDSLINPCPLCLRQGC